MNKQREVIYLLRRKILEWNQESQVWFVEKLESTFLASVSARQPDLPAGVEVPSYSGVTPRAAYYEAQKRFGLSWETFVKQMSLQVVDTLWTEHLDNMEDLREGIGLRGYGGIEPLVEYKREAHVLFGRLVTEVYGSIADRILQAVGEQEIVRDVPKEQKAVNLVYRHDSPAQAQVGGEAPVQVTTVHNASKQVGRNDPCPCGSGKKFKKCHGM
jgi:preprotein translocase subunit SecA